MGKHLNKTWFAQTSRINLKWDIPNEQDTPLKKNKRRVERHLLVFFYVDVTGKINRQSPFCKTYESVFTWDSKQQNSFQRRDLRNVWRRFQSVA